MQHKCWNYWPPVLCLWHDPKLMELLTWVVKSGSINTEFLSPQNVQFGVILVNKQVEFLINNIILMTKFYIHKCRCAKTTPSWNALKMKSSFSANVSKKLIRPKPTNYIILCLNITYASPLFYHHYFLF